MKRKKQTALRVIICLLIVAVLAGSIIFGISSANAQVFISGALNERVANAEEQEQTTEVQFVRLKTAEPLETASVSISAKAITSETGTSKTSDTEEVPAAAAKTAQEEVPAADGTNTAQAEKALPSAAAVKADDAAEAADTAKAEEPAEAADTEKADDAAEAADTEKTDDAAETEDEEEEQVDLKLKETDLGYWFKGIDQEVYSQKLRESTHRIPTTGVGYCAAWVSYVYQDAGLGFVGGNACDMWAFLCKSTDVDEIQEGMIIAVRYSPGSQLGMIYGHCGVIIDNPNYTGNDCRREVILRERLIEQAKEDMDKCLTLDEKKVYFDLIQDYKKEIEKLQEEDTDIYVDIHGHMVQKDKDGHDRWLVAENTRGVVFTPLSSWISFYDFSKTVAWGWGHAYSGRVAVWEGDLPQTVAFVTHEDEATVEDLEEETIETEEETPEEDTSDIETPTTETPTTENPTTETPTTETPTTTPEEPAPTEVPTNEPASEEPTAPVETEPQETEPPTEPASEIQTPSETEPSGEVISTEEIPTEVPTAPPETEPVYTEPEEPVTEPSTEEITTTEEETTTEEVTTTEEITTTEEETSKEEESSSEEEEEI